jgi:glycosyltransferase involved in cell wall biosynthesis
MLNHAAGQSALVSDRLDELAAIDPPDLVFSCSLSRTLYKLETDLPIIFYNDTTARVVLDTYPLYMRAPRGYREACDLMERDAVARTAALIFATERARESAIKDYGYDPERISLAPMGANVLPENPDEVRSPAEAPTREDLRLCVIAADPERKRVDLCVQITEALVGRGVKARLFYIGPPTRRAERSPHAECIGRLSLSDAADRRRHREVLAQSHVQLLPSLGEAFGIAPCESAHYARPSIVTDVGGLPTVVLHDETGFVLPLDAGATEYVEHLERLVNDAALYRRLSAGALERARSTLNWDAWGRTVARVMREVVDGRRTDSARAEGAAAVQPSGIAQAGVN